MTVSFSALLPVYAGDDSELFKRSYRSISEAQTFKPDEIVVVCDGPVTQEVSEFLAARPASESLRVVKLAENVGVAAALNAGLKQAKGEFIARQDADDQSMPERFAKQFEAVNAGFELVGALIEEEKSGNVRSIPESDLLVYAKHRTPIFGPAAVFNREQALQVGGYPIGLKHGEDYVLWAKLLKSGASGFNVQEPLVLYNEEGSFERRSGIVDEVKLLNELARVGVFSLPLAVGRLGWRLFPATWRQKLFYIFK